MPPDKVILFIIGTVVILFGAYYVTYYVGMKASGQTRAGLRNRSITMLDRYSISRDKCFCVVEIAGKVYIVGVSANGMTLLDTLDAQEFAELTENDGQGAHTPWANTPVGRYGNKLTQKVARFIAKKMGKASPEELTEAVNETEENNEEIEKPAFANSLREAERNAQSKEDDEQSTAGNSLDEDASEDG